MGAAAIARWNQHFLLESGESQTMLLFIPLFHALFFFSKVAAIPDHAVRISISSDGEFELFADNETIGMGDHHDEVYKFYTELEHGSKLRVEAVDIHAESGLNPRSHRGIILSTSQGLVTNAEWRCIENNGSVLPEISDWPFAEMIGNNSDWGMRPEILPNASWIWAQKLSSGDYPSKVACVPPPSSSIEEASSKCVDNGCEREFDGQGMCVDFSTSSGINFTSLADQFDLEAGSKTGLCGDQQGECCHCLKKKPEPTTVTPKPTEVSPEPTKITPEPKEVTPDTTEVTPKPTELTQKPTKETQEPTTVTPEPTEVTPEPTEVTSETSKITLEPTEVTPDTTEVTPEPTELTQKPTEVTSETSKITPEPREVKPYAYLIALGGNTVNGTTKVVEKLRSEDNETFQELPTVRFGHSAFVHPVTKDVLVCGGKGKNHGTDTLRDCIAQDHTLKSNWSFHSTLTEPRNHASTVVMESGDVYILGGSFSPDTSDVLRSDSKNWTVGPKLDHPTFSACATDINATSFVTIGGGVSEKDISVYNTVTKSWSKPWPQLTKGRRGHSCVRVNDKVIVAGGYLYSEHQYTATTLTIDINTGKIYAGKSMNEARSFFKMHGFDREKIIIAVGGKVPQKSDNNTEGFSNTMEVWDMSTSIGWIYEKDFELMTGTSDLATVVLETSDGEPAEDPVVVTVITKNATNNEALSNVQVNYTLSNQTQDSIITDSNGQGEIHPRMDLLPGIMVLTANVEGFEPAVVEVQISEEAISHPVTISLSPMLDPQTEMRLVMNWGQNPQDLDLHVLQIDRKSGKETCHTYYENKDGCSGLSLDVDNTKGGYAGAETITWDDADDFLYLMYVHDWSHEPETHIVESEARIALYLNKSGSPTTMEVPTTDTNTYSRWWIIGCMDGASSFVKLGLLSENEPSPSLCNSNKKY